MFDLKGYYKIIINKKFNEKSLYVSFIFKKRKRGKVILEFLLLFKIITFSYQDRIFLLVLYFKIKIKFGK